MPKITLTDPDRLDLLLRLLAKEADCRERKAAAGRVRAMEFRGEEKRGLAGHALGSAEANDDCARQLRALIATAHTVTGHYPTDSTVHPCCQGIGRHTLDCTAKGAVKC